MPSKWAFLKNQFPMLPPDPEYREALAAQIAHYRSRDLAELAERYNLLNATYLEHKAHVSQLGLELDAIEEVMTDKMDDAGLDSIVAANYRWTTMFDPQPSVKDVAALRAWALKHMPDNLTLHPMTLKATVKGLLEQDAGHRELPSGVEVYIKRSFRRTKQ